MEEEKDVSGYRGFNKESEKVVFEVDYLILVLFFDVIGMRNKLFS